MKKTLKAMSCLAGLLLFFPASAALADINDGNWEITTEMKMEGMPIPPTKHTIQQCLTNKDLVANATGSQTGSQKGVTCVMKDQKFSGGKGSWKLRCENKDGSSSDTDGEMSYKGDSYTGKMVMKTTSKGKKGGKGKVMRMNVTMSGKRLGACKK